VSPPKRTRIETTVNEFLQTALTFPTIVYSMLLAVVTLYWVLAATGLADGDSVDAMVGDGDAADAGAAAAMLSRLGLRGVPIMVVATTLIFTAWLGAYFVHLLVLRHLPDDLWTVAGMGTMLGVLVPAVAVTSIVLRPVRRVMAKLRPVERSLVGSSAVVVTPTLSGDYGQASVDDGGAGLILQVRHEDPNQLQRGDRIVLIEYIEAQNAYRVVSEQQFLGR
jgi:hypothetical protein